MYYKSDNGHVFLHITPTNKIEITTYDFNYSISRKKNYDSNSRFEVPDDFKEVSKGEFTDVKIKVLRSLI